ncbi:DNA polymerase beta [Armadillidium nasatum]|uniref:DNA polymerase n=1 Tax=Armadillidium nasatum TaxID=96803 RepID=A0A5N5SJ92_9CRUS|nr:DNA polymerase beta [Armadillidium nasatum]
MSSESSKTENVNKDICNFLLELGNYERDYNRDIHRYNAYRKAAASIAKHPTRISSEKEARQLYGVGVKISQKIGIFLRTGTHPQLEEIRKSDKNNVIKELTRVFGIGPAKADILYKKGIRSIDDLKDHKDLLTSHQIIGLKYFDDFEKRIPRSEIKQIEAKIRKISKKRDNNYNLIICGSYRRGAETCGDIDGLLTHNKFTSNKPTDKNYLNIVIQELVKINLITDTLSLGFSKFMGVCQFRKNLPYRRIDLRLIPKDQYYCGILYFTGSDIFNQNMRAHALEKGYTLNEYSLRPVSKNGVPGKPVRISSEKQIFDILNYPYKKPSERDN